MSLKKDVIITDQEFLRKVSTETTQEEVRELRLLGRLQKSNRQAWTKGCGLSAVQIGIPIRFAFAIFEKKHFTLLNPEIQEGFNLFTSKEGCSSIPNKWMNVRRFDRIVYVSHGMTRKALGRKAVMIQHEVDHMNGILIIDKCEHDWKPGVDVAGMFERCENCRIKQRS